jgi:hypothetical protein
MNRERLPNRRASETFDVEASDLYYTATVGRHADGRIGELFLAANRSRKPIRTPATPGLRFQSRPLTSRAHR